MKSGKGGADEKECNEIKDSKELKEINEGALVNIFKLFKFLKFFIPMGALIAFFYFLFVSTSSISP